MIDPRRMVLLAALCLVAGSVCAQSYPTRPIRWIIDFPAGGASDTLARVVGEKLSATLGQPIVYDNRPGANGIIAYSLGARAAPAVANLVSGQVDSTVTILITATPHLKTGRLRVLGILSEKRSANLPEVPTLVESGIPVVAPGWGGIGGPAGFPKALASRHPASRRQGRVTPRGRGSRIAADG